MSQPVRVTMVGVGGMARSHIRNILKQLDTTQIPVVCEPSDANYVKAALMFKEAGVTPPPNEPDLKRLLDKHGKELDAAFIITPHAYHHDQTKMCMEAGLDVLLEKPMVMNAVEATSLIEARDKTGRLLTVAFPASLSPQVRTAVKMLRSGEVGALLAISGVVWQNWGPNTAGTWRQQPEIAGGGFLFDTGAHMLNLVTELAGQDFVEVAAWLDNRGRPVDVMGSVMGRLPSGAMVTICGVGEAIPVCQADVRAFTEKAIVRTDAWGRFLEVQYAGQEQFGAVNVPPSLGVWQQFMAVRRGEIPNPCPPEVGLRMARLWDAVKASAAQGGVPVRADGSMALERRAA